MSAVEGARQPGALPSPSSGFRRTLCDSFLRAHATMPDTNSIGRRGENLLFLALTALYAGRPYFRPAPLESKWPIIDMIVELEGDPGKLFVVQIKTTTSKLPARGGHVPLDISKNRLAALLAMQIPAYVAAVHEPTGATYLGVPRHAVRTRSLPVTHDLSRRSTLVALRDEVREFWRTQRRFIRARSKFVV
jgi:hypothetical protein